jgi:hypothetical protein
MRNELRKRGLFRGALLLAMVWLLAACGSPRAATEGASHPHDNVGGGNVDVDGYLPNAGLADLGRASDLVVLGRVVAAVQGVRIGSDARMGYTILTLAVDETLKGDAGKKMVDVAMLTQLDGAAVAFEGRPTPKVNDRGIWMLQPIAPEFGRKGYVLTNQNSQILAGEDGLTGGAASSRSGREVAELGDLTSVLDQLRAAVG